MRGTGWLVSVVVALVAPTIATAQPRAEATLAAQIDATKAAMMGDPARALALADAALKTAEALPPSRRSALSLATAQWLDGEAYIFLNQADRAAPLVEAALATVNRLAPNTRLQGDLLRSRGAIAATGNRVQEALAALQAAYRVFAVAHEPRQQALALSDIGQFYETAGDYRRALRYYEQATEAYSADPVLLLTGHNNRAEVLRKLHRDAEAEAQFKTALREARQLGSPLLEVRILSTLAMVQTDRGEVEAAQASVDRATQLASSGEAAGWKPFVLGAGARVASARGDIARAGMLFREMFAGVDLTRTDMPYCEFHQIASGVFGRLGQPDLALAHLVAFHRLADGARDVTASIGAQLMSAQFDFANQNLRISKLQEGQLERDYKLVKQRSLLLTVALGAGTVVLALLLFGTLSLRRSRDRVRAGNVTLTQVNDKLAKALAAKTEFLATTSHEIRTPLNGILGMAQVLLARDALEEDVREKLELLHGAGETMRALVDDILDVAKMEKGGVGVLSAPTPLRKLLLDTGRLWRGHAERKGLDLHLDIDVPATVLSDESRLRQIVSNLLSNAVKFTEHGSVSLSATVSADTDGRETLCVIVKDTGVGIAVDQQALVFDAFHQVDGATTRQFSGSGLGLAICRRLAEAFGGSLTVDSEPQVGSTFTLRVPLLRADLTKSSGVERTKRPAVMGRATILLVGTDFVTQGILLSLLEPHFGTVETTYGCDQAQAILENGGVHHLFIDASANLQKSEGFDTIRALIARAGEANVLSTLLIATDGDVPVTNLMVAGASQSIIKPVTGNALIETLRLLYPAPVRCPAAAEQAA